MHGTRCTAGLLQWLPAFRGNAGQHQLAVISYMARAVQLGYFEGTRVSINFDRVHGTRCTAGLLQWLPVGERGSLSLYSWVTAVAACG